MTSGRVLIVCPPVVTGGPELLHQLGRELRDLGHDASMCYYPFSKAHKTPEPYVPYGVPQGTFADEKDATVIVPEVFTSLTQKINRASVTIWWLSVDYYYGRKGESDWMDLYRRYKTLIATRAPLHRLRHYRHFAQSYYAHDFLRGHGIESLMLSDYINPLYTEDEGLSGTKENLIAFNPRKGKSITRKIIASHKELEFVPIENMNVLQVRKLLQKAKIYMDFGSHPGKDRLPRESAMCGCCVITGTRGAAGNAVDVPIPTGFKLSHTSKDFHEQFGSLVESIFLDYDGCARLYDGYRRMIGRERAIFQEQVRGIFGGPRNAPPSA